MSSSLITGSTKTAYLKLLVAQEGIERIAISDVVVSLDAHAVEAAERAIGAPLSPSVLLLFSPPDVFGMYDLELDQLASLGDEAKEAKVPRTLIPLGRSGTQSATQWVCVASEGRGEALVIYDDGDESRTTVPLATWLEEITEAHLHGGELSEEDEESVARWAKKATLTVRREATAAPSAQEKYRVVHPKFGEGSVLSEDGTGEGRKLEIDFGAGGVRRLLASFVKRVQG